MTKSKWMYAAAGLALVTVVTSAWAGDRANRSNKAAVSFRLASGAAVAGFTPQQTTEGDTIFVASQNLFTVADVYDLFASRVRNTQVVEMTLAPGISEKMAMAARETGINLVAILRGGRVVTVGAIEAIGIDEVTLSGFNAGEVTRLLRIVATKGFPGGAAMVTVVPRSETATAGGAITVDLYVSNVAGLRTYQFALNVSGGDSGTLSRDFGEVDVTDAEFVFGADQVVQAVDERYGRFGATLFDGTVDVTGRRYLGSYTYQVSPDASGSFTIEVNPSQMSFLTDTAGKDIPFHAMPMTVAVQ